MDLDRLHKAGRTPKSVGNILSPAKQLLRGPFIPFSYGRNMSTT